MRLPAATALPMSPSAQPSRERLQTAARELETQFAQMMLKTMRSTSMGNAMFGENSTYRDMHDQQLAREMTRGRGLGLAPMIVQQLERSSGLAPSAVASASAMPLAPAPAAMLPLAMPNSGGGMAMALPASGAGMLAPASSGVSMALVNPLALPVAPPPQPDYPATVPSMDAAHCDADGSLDCSSPEAFVKSIWPHAQRTAAELGVSPKALVAQAALETGWGRKLVGGGSVTRTTCSASRPPAGRARAELGDARIRRRRAPQRDRRLPRLRLRARQLCRLRAPAAAARATPARWQAGTDESRVRLGPATRRYATDPNYAAKISAIVNGRHAQPRARPRCPARREA